MIEYIKEEIEHLLLSAHLGAAGVSVLSFFILAVLLGVVCYLLYMLCKTIAIPVIHTLTRKTTSKLDDIFFNKKFLKSLSLAVSVFVFVELLPQCVCDFTKLPFGYGAVRHLAETFMTLTFVWVITTTINNARDYINQSGQFENYHLEGILQFIKLLVYVLGGVTVIASLANKNPLTVFAGLGAIATVLILIFKDSILGLVASIQISTNKMIKKKDWIVIEDKNVNGIVEEVSLTTVKVRNFDNSVSMIPSYSLVSESFQNWGCMHEVGKRRVMRSILVDSQTIHFTDATNAKTNLSLFRHYAEEYIAGHANVSTEDWIMVRELEPTEHGLPLQLWFYLNITEFVAYEQIASDIMEHLIATLPKYGLRVYQYPTLPPTKIQTT
jgi:miniconductance mechanosensitive channel